MGFHLFGTFIPYYGFFIVVGIGCAFVLGCALCKRRSLHTDDFILLDAYLVAFGFFGAKLLYIIVSFKRIDFSIVFQNLAQFNAFISSGFVFYGGLLGGLLALPFVKKIHHVETGTYISVLAPCLCLAHAFGRIGCSLAGCCYGKPTDGRLYVVYHQSIVAPNDVRLFPVQGIESLCLFILCVVLVAVAVRFSSKTVFAVHLSMYAVLRFILELFRGDTERGAVGPFSISQIISVVLLLGNLGYLLLAWQSKRTFHSSRNSEKNPLTARK